MNIVRYFKIVLYLICFQVYRLYIVIFRKPKSNIKLIAIQTPAYEGNLLAIANKLKLENGIRLYWISYANKDFLKKLKQDGWEAYSDLDITKIPLFYNTQVYIGTIGFGNIPTKYFKPGKWVDLWHGIGFKGEIMLDFKKQINRYNITCLTSEFFAKRYIEEGCLPEKVRFTGYPRTDSLVKSNLNKKEILKKFNINDFNKIAILAPTWEKYKNEVRHLYPFEDNQIKFLDNLNSICVKNKIYFLIRPHKLWDNVDEEKQIRAYIENNKLNNLRYLPFDKYSNVEELLFISDILITDWSSIYSDFSLGNNKLTIFLDVPVPFDGGFNISDKDRDVVVKNNSEFFDVLTNSEKYRKNEKRLRMLDLVLEKMYGKDKKFADGNATDRCIAEILKLF